MPKREVTAEKDFQTIADEHGANAVAWIREEVEALEHAWECDGECEQCTGLGLCSCRDCAVCRGERVICESCGMCTRCHAHKAGCKGCSQEFCAVCHGTGKCQAGADSNYPEAWHDEDAARRRIEEGPLSVDVRSGWHSPGSENKPEEYNILLGTGGPVARLIGDLDEYGQPESAHYEFQDWFKPWTRARLSGEDEYILLRWAQCFYFGD